MFYLDFLLTHCASEIWTKSFGAKKKKMMFYVRSVSFGVKRELYEKSSGANGDILRLKDKGGT